MLGMLVTVVVRPTTRTLCSPRVTSQTNAVRLQVIDWTISIIQSAGDFAHGQSLPGKYYPLHDGGLPAN